MPRSRLQSPPSINIWYPTPSPPPLSTLAALSRTLSPPLLHSSCLSACRAPDGSSRGSVQPASTHRRQSLHSVLVLGVNSTTCSLFNFWGNGGFEVSTMENNFISRSMTTTSYHDVTKSSVKTFVFEINIKRWLIDPLGAQSVIKATRLNHLHLCLYFQADVVWVSQMFREIPKLVIFIWRVKVLLNLYCIL